jgi:hypothetical protein
MTYELHPLCTLFPRLAAAEFANLVADIRANGLREPITLHSGMVLDGGNRYRACLEAGVEPRFVDFAGANAVTFVLSANLHRRHLKEGQQAAIVASAQDWAKAQLHGGDRKSDQAAILPVDTVATRAAQSGASERTQRMADKVAKESPELAKRVAQGEVSLPAAVEQITGKRPGAKAAPAPAPAAEDEGEDLHQMLLDMQRDCERYVRQLGDWEKAMQADGREALVNAIKRYEHAERRQAELQGVVAMKDKHIDRISKALKRIGRAVGEADMDKIADAACKALKAQQQEAA